MEVWDALKLKETAVAKHRASTIGLMHRLNGETVGHTCSECVHLLHRGRYFKCGLARVSSSASTDWRKTYPACGKFEARP